MIPVVFGRRTYQVATAWNELTGRQLLAITRLQGRPFADERAVDEAFRRVLLRVPGRHWDLLNAVQRVELRRLVPVRFLREPTDYAPLTEQLLPMLNQFWRRFHGPRSGFRNLRFAEFIFADHLYGRYLQTNDEAHLNRLVAVLYRPERADYNPNSPAYGGDRREDFNENLLDARTRHIARFPHHAKYAVLLWYRGCRHMLETRFEYVFTADTQQKATQSGWSEVLHELAGGVNHIDATADQLLLTVLREMNRVLRQAEERAESLKNR